MKITKLNNLLTSNLHFLSLTQVDASEMVENEPCNQARGGRPHGYHKSTLVGGIPLTSISEFCTLVLQVIKNKTHNCPLVL